MRIGINALLASLGQSHRNAGISHYTLNLLNALLAFDPANEYTIFLSERQIAQRLAATSPHARLYLAGRGAQHPLGRVFWEQTCLASHIRQGQLDVFHATMHILPARLPCPGVVTIHDLAFLRFPQFYPPARRAYQRHLTAHSARQATCLIAVSEQTRQDLITLLGISAERIHVIYPSVSADFAARCTPENIRQFRQARQPPQHYILYLGTVEPRKNLLRLIEAFARLKQETALPHVLLLAGGGGSYSEQVAQRTRELRLEQTIRFLGYIPDNEKAFWYDGADLFVYPSHYEGFGLPVVEAMACGVPVVTSNVSSLPEVVGDDGRWGRAAALTVAPEDTEALARAMQQGIENFTLRGQLRERGLLRAQRFAPQSSIQQVIHVYTQAAQTGDALAHE